jgi:hypothetical protein
LPRDNTIRQRIIDHLATNGPVADKSGRATSVLKDAVGYKSSDAGFSQLIGAMERDGLLTREIRGKRTFAIAGVATATAIPPPRSEEADAGRLDYDELAAALLARTAKVLAASKEPAEAVGWARRRIEQLEGRIDELQRELARTKAEAKVSADERDQLRGQLDAASHNLSVLTEQSQKPRSGRAAQRLGPEEEALLFELRNSRRRAGS